MAEIHVPSRRQDDDPLDKLAKALTIAQAGFGIYSDFKGLDDLRAKKAEEDKLRGLQIQKTEQDLNQGKAEQEGILSGANRATLLKDMIPAKEGEKGAYMIRSMGQNGQPLVEWVKKTPKELGVGGGMKEPKPDQSKAATFASRLAQAENVFTSLADSGDKGVDASSSAQRLSIFPEGFKSEGTKKRQQAERNFVNSLLRRESGASISDAEFANAEKQYFPRWGDTDAVLEQKAENRRLAFDGLRAEAGPGAMEKLAAQGRMSGGGGQGLGAGGALPKPKTVKQNGHTYTLNEKTGKYE